MDKAVGVCRVDGLFVKVLGIERAAFEACDLGSVQRGAVSKFSGQFSAQISSCLWCATKASKCCRCRSGNAANRSRPREKVRHRVDTPPFQRWMVLSKAAVAPSMRHRRPTHSPRRSSELAAFVPSTRHSGSAKTGLVRQMALEPKLIKLFIVKGAEFPR